MRSIVPFLLILFIAVGLSACAPAGNPTATPTPEDSSSETSPIQHPETTIHGAEISEALAEEIKAAIWASAIPYQGVEYDSIDVSVEKSGDNLGLRVICTSTSCEYPDIYDFTYYTATSELIQTGYVLEAIPPGERSMAIAIALRDEQVINLLESGNLAGITPTARRVLPDIAANFYAPKTLLSVTWTGLAEETTTISVLLDPDEEAVIQTWSSAGAER